MLGNMRNAYKILLQKCLKGRNHLGDRGVDWKIILKYILKNSFVRVWNGFIWLRIGFSSGLF